MRNFFKFTLLFAVLAVLQIFVFDNMRLWIYLALLPYVAFFVLLPLNIPHGWLIVIGFVAGAALDLLAGTGGLHAIASTFTGFVRPGVFNVTMGRDFWRDSGGALSRREIRSGKWFRYAALLTFLHCAVFFLFEAMTWRYFGHTALKIIIGSAGTIPLVWLAGLLYPVRR